MGHGFTDLLGPGALLWVAAMWLAIMATAVITPFVLVSVARSLRGIQRELQRLSPPSDAPAPHVERAARVEPDLAPARSMGHQLLR